MEEFPTRALQPTDVTQASLFLTKYPEYDGDLITVAIFDTGVDPGAPGLQVTPNGKNKIVDIIDASGSGDVVMTKVVKVGEDGTLMGLTGRKLILGNWDNPSGEYRVGIKNIMELFPNGLKSRINSEKKKEFDLVQRDRINELQRRISLFDQEKEDVSKEELEERLTFLESITFTDKGNVFDCVSFQDSSDIWRCVLDTTFTGDLSDATVLADYTVDFEYSTFSEKDLLNYSVKFYDGGNTLSIVTNAGSHGTHVAGIVGAYFPNEPELNGVAPGVQIVSVKIGDHRLGSMETGPGLIRGLLAAKNAGVDLINMSYGEPTSVANKGKFSELARELVIEHGVIFVSSAGNNGPALSTVGAPGSTTEHLIGVGAMVTPEMMDVDYSMREKLPSIQYTWSSRGPAEDGSLGVSISAPGGAISPIPNWTLSKTQLMNGTSMSSPNACGCIALVLSGLKQSGSHYNPTLVKQALQNTAFFEKGNDYWTRGYGIVQVNESFDYLVQNNAPDTPFIKVLGSGGKRGIYWRDLNEVETAREFSLAVSLEFSESFNNREKVDYEKRVNIISTQSWVQVPSHLVLMNSQRNLKVFVDPTSLKNGQAHYAEIQGFDSANPSLGPIFRFPVTVIKPRTVSPTLTYTKDDIRFSPGKFKRFFFAVPESSNWASIKLESNNIEQNMLYFLQWSQVLPNKSSKFTMDDKYLWLNSNDVKTQVINVQGGSTLEICTGQFWSQLGTSGSVNFSVEFHGYSISTDSLHLSANSSVDLFLSNPDIDEQILPTAALAVVEKKIYPDSSKITPLSLDRDVLFNGQLLQQLKNTYTLDLKETLTVISRFQCLDQFLYESSYSSQFWMICNQFNKVIHQGDFLPVSESLPQGKYKVYLFITHENKTLLKKLEAAPIQIEIQLANKDHIALDIYSSKLNSLNSNGKFGKTATTLRRGNLSNLVISPPEESKLPKYVSNGDVLRGYLSIRDTPGEINVPKNGYLNPVGASIITYTVSKKPSSSSANSKTQTIQEKYYEQQKSSDLKFVQSILNTKKYSEYFEILESCNFVDKYENDVAFGIVHLQMLEKSADKTDADALISALGFANAVLETFDVSEIALFFGVKHTSKEKEAEENMKKKQSQLIQTLTIKANLLCKLYLLQSIPSLKEDFEQTVTDLRKWTDVDKEAKDVLLSEYKVQNKLGKAASHLQANLTTKESYLEFMDLLRLLNADHLLPYYENEILINFPEEPFY